MRLLKVTGPWPHSLNSKDMYEEQSAHITVGEEGPGLYLRDCVVPLEEGLGALRPKTDPTPLLAARLSTDTSKPLKLLRETPGVMRRIKEGKYYGECLVHVCFDKGRHEFHAVSFGEKLVKSSFGSRVVREYLPLEDAEGVRVEARSEDGQEALITLCVGSSFRLHRSTEGKQSVVVISWTGRRLKSFNPAFHESRGGREETKEPRSRRRRRRDSTTATMSESCPELSNLVSLAQRRQA